MKVALNFLNILALCVGITAGAYAQVPETTTGNGQPETPKTESSAPDKAPPLDGVVEKRTIVERKVLAYDPIREADVFWEKRIWRVIDIREKINLTFSYPEMPFAKILFDAALKGDITVYNANDNSNGKFDKPFSPQDVADVLGGTSDTTETTDPETYEIKFKIIRNDLKPESVKSFRVKELWYFDSEASVMKVRILGIAPIIDVEKNGEFRGTRALFWLYYPECREMLSKHRVYNIGGNDASPMSWENLFEARFFSSYIMKESNVYDRFLVDYVQGVDQLLEGEKIKNEIFNFEQDLWAY